jgi:hypothetical protein
MELDNLNMGGVSFLLRPVEGAYGIYDVWMYITPSDARFSNKHAVDRLRTAQKSGVVPFTQIQLDGMNNINDQLFDHFAELSKNPPLPSTIFDIIVNLRGYNLIAEMTMSQAKKEIQNSVQSYYEEPIT